MKLRFKLAAPLLLLFAAFGLVLHFYWRPVLLETEYLHLVEREEDIARNLIPVLQQDLLQGDLAALYSTLSSLEAQNVRKQLEVELWDPEGRRLYPLQPPAPPRSDRLIRVNMPIVFDQIPLGDLRMRADWSSEYRAIAEHIDTLSLTALLICALAVFGSMLLLHRIVLRPLQALQKASAELAAGSFDIALQTRSADEVGQLARSFASMSQKLQQYQRELRQSAADAYDHMIRYRTVIDSIPGALITLDRDGNIRDLNQAAEQIFGYPLADIEAQPCKKLFPDADCKRLIAALEASPDSGTSMSEQSGRRHDGSRLPMQLFYRLMQLGGTSQLVLVAMDITALKESERQMRLARDNAEQASLAKSEFLSRMSHELRTPLNAILGFGQMLLMDEETLADEQRDDIREIVKAGQHLLELINEILDLSQIEAGHLHLSLGEHKLPKLVHQALAQIQPLAAARSIRFETELGTGLPAVRVDPRRLTQVLLNLFSNAIKYNRDEGWVTVTAEPCDDSRRLRVSIRDSGRGIAPEVQPRMFRPFERLDSAYSEIEGSGIGLSLCSKLIEAMDGEIGVQSSPGEGSTFWFELPLATADSEI